MNHRTLLSNSHLTPSFGSEYDYKTLYQQIALKCKLIGQELQQANQYIQDLETNLKINKSLIMDLISNVPSITKKIISDLNKENHELRENLKTIMNEGKKYQEKLFMAENALIEYKSQHRDPSEEFNHKKITIIKNQEEKMEFSFEKYNLRPKTHLSYNIEEIAESVFETNKAKASVNKIIFQNCFQNKNNEENIKKLTEENFSLKEELSAMTKENKLLKKDIKTYANSKNSTNEGEEYIINIEGKNNEIIPDYDSFGNISTIRIDNIEDLFNDTK